MTSPENPGDKPYDFVKKPPTGDTSQPGTPAYGTDPNAGYAPPSYGTADGASQGYDAQQGYGAPQGYDAQQPNGTGQQYGAGQYGAPQYGAPSYGAPQYGAPAGYGYPGAPDPTAPYGRDPATGEPLSDKSKLVAGLLQIFLGTLGVGRFYIGDNTIGGIQLGLTIIGYITAIFLIGFVLIFGVAIWALVDGIMMLTGSVRDKNGLKLGN